MTANPAAAASTALGPNHGYCLDGDFVHLNADISLGSTDLADDRRWALQLWASPTGFCGKRLNGIKVAELALQPIAGCFNVGGCVPALPPAGNTGLNMALALVGEGRDGQSIVADLAVYPSPQQFSQPQLQGNVSCDVTDGSAEIAIEHIANPRNPDNLSGTLALEVWALEQPYAGGAWIGMPVASMVLGQLAGGERWSDCRYQVPAAEAPVGTALTVMLREWTPTGYLTRDYRNLPASTAAKAGTTVDEPAATKTAAAKPNAEVDAVSVNTASAAELTAVKGVSKAVAKGIIAGRPYATLDELVRAKGVGQKLLEKLRKFLKV